MENSEEISKVLESGSSDEKISILEKLSNTKDFELIEKIIICLDDPDIKVRGEAFSSLILNENEISNILIKGLKDKRKNIRGFAALVLANRKDANSIDPITILTNDERSMVRSCALGALGHLKAHKARNAITRCLLDSNIDVRKSALKAIVDINEPLSEQMIHDVLQNKDSEIEKLLVRIKKSKGGPGGI